jgi:hypothetical protein
MAAVEDPSLEQHSKSPKKKIRKSKNIFYGPLLFIRTTPGEKPEKKRTMTLHPFYESSDHNNTTRGMRANIST